MAPTTPGTPRTTLDRKAKTIFQLDSPFTTTQWPQISPQNHDTILELLYSLLSPIGQYRASHITSSKGKRSRKRKRKEAKNRKEDGSSKHETQARPPWPEISQHIAIGLSSVTRILESSSRKANFIELLRDQSQNDVDVVHGQVDGEQMLKSEQKDTQSDKLAPKEVFSVIFVSQTNQSGILHAQIPQLVATASLAYPDSPATRLIQLYKGSEERLCDALGIPRVSCVGIFESAPFSISLIDLIRECVPPMEIAWLKEAMDAKYLPLKVNSIQTFAPVGKKS